MKRRSARWLAALLALGLLAGACSNSDSATKKGGPTDSDSAASASGNGMFSEAEMNAPQHEGTPRKGGNLTFGLESNVLSLDPAGQMIQPADVTVGLAIYDNLVQYDDKGHPSGGMAESFKSSDDLKTWTFELRSGIKFGDGTPMDADAVKKHFERLAQSPQCSCKSGVEKITSIDTPDPLTVVFHLVGPDVAFPVFMSNSPGFITSPAQVEKHPGDFGTHPMGAGPFRVVTMADTITVERNPYYWRKDPTTGQQLPYLDKVVFKPLPDTKTRLQAVQSAGGVQIMQTADTDNLVEANKDKNLVIQPVSGSSSTILILNQAKPPFDDIRARQALNYSLDRDGLNQQAYQGARVPAYGFFPPSDPYYDPDGQLPPYDPEKARELIDTLKKEGKPTNFKALCISTPEATTDFQVLKAQAAKVGVQIELEQLDQATFVAKMLSGQADFQVACFRSPQIPDPNDVDSAIHTGGSLNLAKISSPVIDKAMDQGRTTADFDKRKAQYDIVQKELAKQVLVVPLLFDLYGNIHVKDVSGLERPWPNSLGLINVGYLYYKS